jgi:hypothetical protein
MAMNPRLLVPRATGFNPKSIAGLRVWLDMSKESSVTLNGSTVSQVNDLSGNGLHATQPTAANQPTYAGTLNGRRVVTTSVSPATNLFVTNPIAANTGLTIFSVLKKLADTANARHISLTVTTGELVLAGQDGWLPLYRDAANSAASFADGVNASVVPGGFAANETAVFTLTNSGTQVINYKNGQAGSTTAISAGLSATFQRLYISGRIDSAATNPVSQDVGEVLVYTRVVSAAERQRIERYLGKKWGVTVA